MALLDSRFSCHYQTDDFWLDGQRVTRATDGKSDRCERCPSRKLPATPVASVAHQSPRCRESVPAIDREFRSDLAYIASDVATTARRVDLISSTPLSSWPGATLPSAAASADASTTSRRVDVISSPCPTLSGREPAASPVSAGWTITGLACHLELLPPGPADAGDLRLLLAFLEATLACKEGGGCSALLGWLDIGSSREELRDAISMVRQNLATYAADSLAPASCAQPSPAPSAASAPPPPPSYGQAADMAAAHAPPPPYSEAVAMPATDHAIDELLREGGRLLAAQQALMLQALGCGGMASAVASVSDVCTPAGLCAANSQLRDPDQPQVLHCRQGSHVVVYMPGAAAASRPACASSSSPAASAASGAESLLRSGFAVKVVPYASDEQLRSTAADKAAGLLAAYAQLRDLGAAAREATNATALQAASAALFGEAGPFLAPIYVTTQRRSCACSYGEGPEEMADKLADVLHDRELVMVFPFCPSGDGLSYLDGMFDAILWGAALHAPAPEQLQQREAWCHGVVSQLTGVMEQVARGMAARLRQLHHLGVITGDHKLENFLPCAGAGCGGVLIDSESVELCGGRGSYLDGAGVYTEQHAAPEQLDPQDPWRGPCSDVWALGSSVTAMMRTAMYAAQAHCMCDVEEVLRVGPPPHSRLRCLLAACHVVDCRYRADIGQACAILGL